MIGRYILCVVFVIWGLVLGQIAGGLAGWFIDEVMGAGDIWRRVSIFCGSLLGGDDHGECQCQCQCQNRRRRNCR